MMKKSRFAWKRGVLLGRKINDSGWKGGGFSSKIREKGVFFNLGCERGRGIGGGSRMLEICFIL